MTQKRGSDMKQLLFRRFTEKAPGIEKGTTTAFLRLLKPQPPEGFAYQGRAFNGVDLFTDGAGGYFFPKGTYRAGDIIYIREEWTIQHDDAGEPHYIYKAGHPEDQMVLWKQASYMPIEAARFFLEVQSTAVCRIGEIEQEDARAAGAAGRSWRRKLQELWDGDLKKTEADVAFNRDPWVEVVRFQLVERPEGLPTGFNERILAHGSDYNRYTIRLAETGELIAQGTAAECAKAMGYTTSRRIYVLLNQVASGKNRKYTIETTQEPRAPRPRNWLRGD